MVVKTKLFIPPAENSKLIGTPTRSATTCFLSPRICLQFDHMFVYIIFSGKRMRSGFRTDRTDRTDTEAEENPLGNKIYFSNDSMNEPLDDHTRDGLLINDFPNSNRIDYNHYIAKKKTRPLKLRKKLYEFYAAPISKYFCHSVSSSDISKNTFRIFAILI